MAVRGKRTSPIGNKRGHAPKGMKAPVDPHGEETSVRPLGGGPRRVNLSFEVPLPYKVLSKNWKTGDRRAKAEATARYRQEVMWAAEEAMRVAGWGDAARATISLTFGTARVVGSSQALEQALPMEWQPYRPRDVWNAITAFHPGFDGLTDAGVWPDDSYRWASLGKAHIDPDISAGVRVFIQKILG